MIYFNEHDKFAANWLHNLWPQSHVDERDIQQVAAADLSGFRRVHFFGGIGGWELALELAGWPVDREVWTGSCPCQPFSSAGKRSGEKDERHLWPKFYRLISERRPATIFGEQVASNDGLEWIDGVSLDLEEIGYAVAACDMPAACVGSPQKRQRIWWVAHTDEDGRQAWDSSAAPVGYGSAAVADSWLDNGRLGNTHGYHRQWWSGPLQVGWNVVEADIERRGRKFRAQWRIKPGLSIVAYGIPGRVGKICGAGNSIVPQVAAEFIKAAMDSLP